MDSEGEESENLSAVGSHRGSPDEDAARTVGDELDETFVADGVHPSAGGRRNRRHADRDVDAGGAGGVDGESDRADLRVGERHSRERRVVGRCVRLTEVLPGECT